MMDSVKQDEEIEDEEKQEEQYEKDMKLQVAAKQTEIKNVIPSLPLSL